MSSNLIRQMDKASFLVHSTPAMRNFKPINPEALRVSFTKAYPNGVNYEDIRGLHLEFVVCLVKLGLVDMSLIQQAFDT
jgi:hypothetical protein